MKSRQNCSPRNFAISVTTSNTRVYFSQPTGYFLLSKVITVNSNSLFLLLPTCTLDWLRCTALPLSGSSTLTDLQISDALVSSYSYCV